MKDQLGGKMMSVFATLRLKTYSYLADYKNKNRKEKQILNLKIIKIIQKQLKLKTKYIIQNKIILMWIIFKKYHEFISNNKLILKSQERFRSEKQVNKVELSANDGKRIQSIDSIETYTYETNKEMIHRNKRN